MRAWSCIAGACAIVATAREPAMAQAPAADTNAPTISVSGRVVDARDRPITGARVTVDGTSFAVTTGRDGRYHLDGVTPGATIVVDHEGYQTGVATAESGTVRDVVLLTIGQGTETIEVHGEPPPAAPGAASIDREEVQRVPGTGGEITRALSAMPGVVNQQLPTSPTGIVIRGSAPQDSKILIDDFEVPLLYHFVAFRAILPTEAIDKLDYIPGGFDVAYGRAGSGIVALTTRAGSSDHRTEQAELSLLDASALAQGPIDKDTTYMLAVRRSTIDLILPEIIPASANISLLTYPRYYDLQARIDHTLNARWKLTLSSIGSDDEFSLFRDKMQNPDKRFYAQTAFLRTTLSARYHDGPWNLVLALSEMPERFDFQQGALQALRIDRLDTGARGELTRSFGELAGLREVVWRVGGEADISRYSLAIAAPPAPQSGIRMGFGGENSNPNDVATRFDGIVWTPDFAGWTALTASLDPRIRATTALRVDGFGRSGDVTVEPRGDLEVKLADKLTARLAAGSYRRPPEYQQELLHSSLHPEVATQLIAGVEDEPRPGIRVQTSIYYTDRSNLIVTDPNGQLSNTGRGTTYGAELLGTLREGPWFAWLSYSYSHSTRVDCPGAASRLFEYDQPHSLNAALSWKRGKWQLGARFEYYSGLPYTPVIGSVFDSDTNYYTPIYGPLDSQRAPAHHQLDLRVDRTWRIGSLALTGFIDVQNVYLNRSVTSYAYNYDFSQQFAFQSLPIIPTTGIRGVL